VYCQLGRTTNLTVTREEYVPTDQVIREIEESLRSSVPPDYITLSGSGEPTLHLGFGDIIDGVRRVTETPVAVITNSSLMADPDVRRDCARADLVVPSLDVADRKMFPCVNRPHRDVVFEEMAEGLVEFGRQFQGKMWLEVFLLYGVTGVAPYVRRMIPLIERINPERIQLNTVVRPPAESVTRPVPREDLEELARILGPKAEIIAHFSAAEKEHEFVARREDVLAMLERRPCTLDDIVTGLGMHRNEAIKYVDELKRAGRIRTETVDGVEYYVTSDE
jgi:wyosine [tRNA(Phe)-imidazoG37] synthetase (radical SAM superfamily)